MSFFAPALLYGLFAAAIPVLIHLLNKRRHRTIQWAAMQFLLSATQESRGKKKLKHILILICRTLAVAAVIFAISRPAVSSLLGWSGGSVDTVVLLLDRSVSMEAQEGESDQSKREYVIERVAKAMKELNGARLVLIDSATLQAQDVPSPDVLGEISTSLPTSTSSNIPALLEAATRFIQSTNPGRTEIWVASDQQRSSWAPLDGRWNTAKASIEELSGDNRLRILSLRGQPERNVAVNIISARRIDNELFIDVSLSRRQDKAPLTIPLTFSLDGARFAENVTLTGQTLRFQKRLSLAGRESGGSGWVEIPSDSNSQDNSSYFTYGANVPTEIAVVTTQPSVGRFLRLAAAPPQYGNFKATVVTPSQAGNLSLPDIATVLWQAPLPDESSTIAGELDRFVQSGGTLVLMPPLKDSDTSFLGLTWQSLQVAPTKQYFIPGDWNHDDGPLRDGADSTPIPVQKLKSIRRRGIEGDLTALATWDSGELLLGRKILSQGQVIVLSSIPDYTWSNLADADLLLPLIQRVIETGSKRLGGNHSMIAGTARSRPLDGETVERLDTASSSASIGSGYDAGLFRYGQRTVAINRSADEDDWEILSEVESRDLLRGTGATLFNQSSSEDDSLIQEVWRAFLVACLLFLIAEAILCLPSKVAKTDASNPKRKPQIS